MPATAATNTVANQANLRAQQRGYNEGFARAREGWALWHSRLPVQIQVALTTHSLSPDSITYVEHKNGAISIKINPVPYPNEPAQTVE